MKSRIKPIADRLRRYAIAGSIVLNLFVALPFLVLLTASDGIRLYIYEQLADRIGRTKIAFIGDSITRDGGIWGFRIGRPFFEVRNLAHAGLYTKQIGYQAQIASAEGADWVFVMVGINDLPKTPAGADSTFKDYVGVIETLRQSGVTPVIQSTLFREGGEDVDFVKRLNRLLSDYAEENGIHFLDLNKILSTNSRLKSEFSRDGTHLAEAAYEAWSKEVKELLKTLN